MKRIKKENRGGKRPGSGRKKKARFVKVISFDQEAADKVINAKKNGFKSQSEYVNKAVIAYPELKQQTP